MESQASSADQGPLRAPVKRNEGLREAEAKRDAEVVHRHVVRGDARLDCGHSFGRMMGEGRLPGASTEPPASQPRREPQKRPEAAFGRWALHHKERRDL